MHIDWATLAEIGVVAAAAALAVVLLVALAVVASSPRPGRLPPGAEAERLPVAHPVAGTAVAVLCVAAAGSIVCLGLYLIIA